MNIVSLYKLMLMAISTNSFGVSRERIGFSFFETQDLNESAQLTSALVSDG